MPLNCNTLVLRVICHLNGFSVIGFIKAHLIKSNWGYFHLIHHNTNRIYNRKNELYTFLK